MPTRPPDPAVLGTANALPTPLWRDPVHDGATDPIVVRHPSGTWRMLWTQRRPSAVGPGVTWVHGTDLGVAESDDGGATWRYLGTLGAEDGLPVTGTAPRDTYWAPEIIEVDGTFHMFLTVVPGVPDGWPGHPRWIHHLTSTDLDRWTDHGPLPLSSERAIDACVHALPDGGWRLWYKDEADGSTTWAADSADLWTWIVGGQVIGGRPHEGAKAFRLSGWYWMVVDEWRGQMVYRSSDLDAWDPQGLILDSSTDRPDDVAPGHHAHVEVLSSDPDADDAVAWIVYFTHPERDTAPAESAAARRSSVLVAELQVRDGLLGCHRGEIRTRLPR
ncbi:family 43 glycosylhydrolase [Isoptericola aurantiacus]|uniref:family 43 glycosylhydrolase n=1 Tax=Isoptericola aurantiacus TaxID=3377839 RepID=UPI00383BD982